MAGDGTESDGGWHNAWDLLTKDLSFSVQLMVFSVCEQGCKKHAS